MQLTNIAKKQIEGGKDIVVVEADVVEDNEHFKNQLSIKDRRIETL